MYRKLNSCKGCLNANEIAYKKQQGLQKKLFILILLLILQQNSNKGNINKNNNNKNNHNSQPRIPLSFIVNFPRLFICVVCVFFLYVLFVFSFYMCCLCFLLHVEPMRIDRLYFILFYFLPMVLCHFARLLFFIK